MTPTVLGERVARLEERTETDRKVIGSLEGRIVKVEHKINAITVKFAIVISISGAVGSVILQQVAGHFAHFLK